MLPTAVRNTKESPASIRRAGRVPAVYYGRKEKAVPISIAKRDFEKAWKEAGETGVVTLQTPSRELDALIHDIDRDPVTGAFRHADFYVFEEGQKMKLKVPIEFTGIAPAVKDLSGVLVKVLRELEIEAAPRDIPRAIQIDTSSLVDFKSTIIAKSVSLPKGVVLITKQDEVVAAVYEPKDEPVEETPVDLSAIEVEKKGREAKEGEEGAAEAVQGGTPAPAKGEKKEKK